MNESETDHDNRTAIGIGNARRQRARDEEDRRQGAYLAITLAVIAASWVLCILVISGVLR